MASGGQDLEIPKSQIWVEQKAPAGMASGGQDLKKLKTCKKVNELGPDGSVWAITYVEKFSRGLGRLWNASRGPKRAHKIQKCLKIMKIRKSENSRKPGKSSHFIFSMGLPHSEYLKILQILDIWDKIAYVE